MGAKVTNGLLDTLTKLVTVSSNGAAAVRLAGSALPYLCQVSPFSIASSFIYSGPASTAHPGSLQRVCTYASVRRWLLQVEWHGYAGILTEAKFNAAVGSHLLFLLPAAYLAGWDAVSELAALAAPGDATQPNKLQFDAVRVPFKGNPDYWTQVRCWVVQLSRWRLGQDVCRT